MAFSTGKGGTAHPWAISNVTPLVDVMLVLLIIFMVTARCCYEIQIDLPQPTKKPVDPPPDPPVPIACACAMWAALLAKTDAAKSALRPSLLVEARAIRRRRRSSKTARKAL